MKHLIFTFWYILYHSLNFDELYDLVAIKPESNTSQDFSTILSTVEF